MKMYDLFIDFFYEVKFEAFSSLWYQGLRYNMKCMEWITVILNEITDLLQSHFILK